MISARATVFHQSIFLMHERFLGSARGASNSATGIVDCELWCGHTKLCSVAGNGFISDIVINVIQFSSV